MEAARQPAEQKLVLEVLKRYPNLEMLKLAVKAAQVPELKDDATEAALGHLPKARQDGRSARNLVQGRPGQVKLQSNAN